MRLMILFIRLTGMGILFMNKDDFKRYFESYSDHRKFHYKFLKDKKINKDKYVNYFCLKYFLNKSIFWQNPYELNDFVKFLNNYKIEVNCFLEVGFCQGATFDVWASIFAESKKRIAIDSSFECSLFKRINDKCFFVKNDSHSQESLMEVKNILGKDKLDFLFIDGDHSYDGVKKDYEMYGDLVRLGGVIVFHDIAANRCEGVMRFWQEVKNNKEYYEFICKNFTLGIGCIIK